MIENLIAIGSSTGGPRALERVLTSLPSKINAAIIIAQHMPKGFTASLAQRLNNICNIRVFEAKEGDIIKNDTAYIAPGGQHMIVELDKNNNCVIHLFEDKIKSYYKPSVDALMESVAALPTKKRIGVILTGMGSDGAKGLKALKQNGGIIIAQDEATCVVFGMPAAAIKEGIVDKVLPLDKIAEEIIRIVEA